MIRLFVTAALLLAPLGGATVAQDPASGKLPSPERVKPQLYATGFAPASAVALDGAGNLYVANYRLPGTIGRITPDGTASIFCDLAELAPVEGAMPQVSAVRVDASSRLIAADGGAGRLLRIAADGKSFELLADRHNGQRFVSPSAVALDLAGNIYFADLGEPNAEKPAGIVFKYDINTKKVSRLVARLDAPGGLAVTPDQKQLCVAESGGRKILVYDLMPGADVGPKRVLIEFGDKAEKDGAAPPTPRGIAFDAKGRLYAAMWPGHSIKVIDMSRGKVLATYGAGGDGVSDCHFHAGSLFTAIAAKEAVFRLKLGVEGFRYSGPRP